VFHVNGLEERSVHRLLLKLIRLMNSSPILPFISSFFSSMCCSMICARDFSLGLNSTLTRFFLLSFLRSDGTHSRFFMDGEDAPRNGIFARFYRWILLRMRIIEIIFSISPRWLSFADWWFLLSNLVRPIQKLKDHLCGIIWTAQKNICRLHKYLAGTVHRF